MIFRKIFTCFLTFLCFQTAFAGEERVRYLRERGATGCALNLSSATEVTAADLPLIHVTDRPIFNNEKFARLRELFNTLDSGELGGFGYGEHRRIQMRKTPYIHIAFTVKDGKIATASIVDVTQLEAHPTLPKEFLISLLQDLVERMLEAAPDQKTFFEGHERGAAVSFLRYVVKPGKRYPSFPWHHDYGSMQAITPVSLPASLRGGHLQLQKRPGLPESNILVDIVPKENHPVIFRNDLLWHQVTPFELPWSGPGAKPEYRDIFTVEIHDQPGLPVFGTFKHGKRR